MHVGIVMGSDSDLPVMKKAFAILDDFGVTYDVTIASAHRTPKKLADFVAAEEKKGVGAFIAGAGMAAALPGVVASLTLKPVIGVPLSGAKLDGMDALLAIVQMPPGIPVATVGINGALNAGILAVQMLAVGDEQLQEKLATYKENLKQKIVKANEELAKVSFKYKTN